MNDIKKFRQQVEVAYSQCFYEYKGGFDEILCYELHSQPINPRIGLERGLTFKELAQKWGISVSFLGELIADHCRKLED